MARRLRIEYPGAIYHVINRGNFRGDVFDAEGAAAAFERTMFEACERHHWRLHAYVIMRNHFHLALETPEANLVQGMHWLQSAYCTRFTRFQKKFGHVFQGRYRSILVEDSAALSRVADYIHLNPRRAHAVPPDGLLRFRWSSLWHFTRPDRPGPLYARDILRSHELTDQPADWSCYVERLEVLAADEDEQVRLGHADLSSGYAIGTAGWRRAVAEQYQHLALSPGLEASEAQTLRETVWNARLKAAMGELGKADGDLLRERLKGAPWKIELAVKLRAAGVPACWIGLRLGMGGPNAVRAYVNRGLRPQRSD
ncbi:MAG TPA: transposase [Opitutaceae bacterium]